MSETGAVQLNLVVGFNGFDERLQVFFTGRIRSWMDWLSARTEPTVSEFSIASR